MRTVLLLPWHALQQLPTRHIREQSKWSIRAATCLRIAATRSITCSTFTCALLSSSGPALSGRLREASARATSRRGYAGTPRWREKHGCKRSTHEAISFPCCLQQSGKAEFKHYIVQYSIMPSHVFQHTRGKCNNLGVPNTTEYHAW